MPIHENILALMVGTTSEEYEDEEKQTKVGLYHIKENLHSHSKRKVESLLDTLMDAYQSINSEK